MNPGSKFKLISFFSNFIFQLIALRLYEGHLKLIQWQEGKELKSFNLRFEDNNVTDLAFLEATG